jgi:hypothetical protein
MRLLNNTEKHLTRDSILSQINRDEIHIIDIQIDGCHNVFGTEITYVSLTSPIQQSRLYNLKNINFNILTPLA